jgi:SnoaL-like polyketide cyclase
MLRVVDRSSSPEPLLIATSNSHVEEEVRTGLRHSRMRPGAPELRDVDDILFSNGDFTCLITHFTGIFTAPLELPDGTTIQPTGKSFDVLYSTTAKWDNGKIVKEFLFYDNGTFLTQIGVG